MLFLFAPRTRASVHPSHWICTLQRRILAQQSTIKIAHVRIGKVGIFQITFFKACASQDGIDKQGTT